MNKKTLYILILIMGLITATINSANGILADKVGLFESVLVVHIIGTIVSIIYYILFEKNKDHSVLKLALKKPHLILGGFIGSFAVVSISYSVQNISVLIVSTALIAGQFIFSFFIDINGWFGFEKVTLTKRKILSLALMLGGVFLLAL